MKAEPKRVLFINSEMLPFLPETKISTIGRYLPQGIQERGKEIRSFMPRYGCVNERRNQLHEVIRLSGMNIVVNDVDHPLIIKVASVPQSRMQAYFIDNEDYFYRKYMYCDDKDSFFADNDERAIFFARGVLETVKKLRWKPDIIHCHGWISHFIPIYLKKAYKDDPIFTDSRILLSIYDEIENEKFDKSISSKAIVPGIKPKDLDVLSEANGINLAKLAIQYADGVIIGSENINDQIVSAIEKSGLPTLPYIDITNPENAYIDKYNSFYDQILGENAV